MQPRRLSRAAGKLCRKHAWNARSKQRHVRDAKQVLLWKGWVLQQRLNDVRSRVGATATRAHVESPLRTELCVDSCSVRHQGNCCASTREIPATWISLRAQARRHVHATDCCGCMPQAHLDLSPCAKRHVHATDCCGCMPPAHLDLFPCASKTKTCSCDRLLRSHAVSTLGSRSVHRETCSGEKTPAFSCREHSWISLRAQENLFMRQHCCARTPQAHLDLSPCASKKTCSCDRLLRVHATSTLGSLSVRKQTCSGKTTAACSRREHTWISFRAQARRRHVHATDCCGCTPQAHLDLVSCAKRHVPAKRLLRSHTAPQDR